MPKRAIPLTEEQIADLVPKARAYVIGDGHGLYLLIEPTGKKRWRMDYKRLGKETSISFGTHPEVALSAARLERDKALQLIGEGKDPVYLKREQNRQIREATPRPLKLRLSMNADGAMVIENSSSRLILTVAHVAALRAFLIATNDEIQGK